MEDISETSVDTAQKEPEEGGMPSLHFWKSQLDAYDNISKAWKGDVDDAFDEYLNLQSNGGNTIYGRRKNADDRRMGSHFPIFWSAVRTVQPALYSRSPVIVSEKSFKEMRDPVARLASIMIERLGKYAVKTSGFDRSMALAVTHFLMSEKVTVRVIFDATISQVQTKNYLNPVSYPDNTMDHQIMMSTGYVDERGEPYEGEPDQDEEGRYFSTGIQETIDALTCETEVPHYKDIRHTPNARHWGEIDWISFDSLLTRTEFEETFGEEIAAQITFGPVGQDKDKDRNKDMKGLPVYYATVTEIWDKKKRRVYYLNPGFGQWLKHKNNPEGEDPYQLKGFFPVPPFMLGTFGPNDLFTSPAYVQLKDFIQQVHGAFDRVRRLILALKKAGIFDASKPELAELNAVASEGQFIGVADLDMLLGPSGSLEKLIQFFPTEKIAQGVDQLKQSMLDFENKFYDLWGIPDIYRGITDPNETLGAQQLKGKHMSVRFAVLQREVQRLARDTIELMCDLYLGKCPEDKLLEIMGYQFMTPEDQQIAPQALQLLKSDSERCIRIEIETDSTITQNINADIEQKNYLARTFFDGLASLKGIDPVFLPVAAKAVEMGIKSLQQGKYLEGDLEQALDSMVQAAQQQAQQPPPPDPKLQIEQMKQQGKMQEIQMTAGIKQQELQGKMQLEQIQAQSDMAVEQQKAGAEIQRKNAETQNKLALEQQLAQMQAQVLQLKAQLDHFTTMTKVSADMGIKQFEADQAAKLQAKEAERAFTQSPPEGDTVHIHIGGKS